MPRTNRRDWEKLFRSADKDGNGTLDYNELRALFRSANSKIPESQISEIFDYFDGPNGDRRITLREFTDGIRKVEKFHREVESKFHEFDRDGSGYLDRNEMKRLLESSGQQFTPREINEIIRQADTNGDGQISLDEFLNALT